MERKMSTRRPRNMVTDEKGDMVKTLGKVRGLKGGKKMKTPMTVDAKKRNKSRDQVRVSTGVIGITKVIESGTRQKTPRRVGAHGLA